MIDLARIRAARVYDVAIQTPLEHAPLLSRRTGNEVWLKREDLQPVFSFKLRGAYAMMANLTSDELERGVVAASAGNHAQGVALAARRLGTRATIVVPRTAPEIKLAAIRDLGADLVLHGDSYDEAYLLARGLEAERGLVFIPPYDHPDVIAGQGTVGVEIAEAGAFDAVFVAVGGGGLIAGIAVAMGELSPTTRIIGVEPEGSDAMTRSIEAGRRITIDRADPFADGVAVRTPGELPFEICRRQVHGMIRVSNDEICGAIKEIFEDRRAVLEPAGALAYAGLKRYAETSRGERLVAIACGANLNFDRLRMIAERAEVGEGHEALLAVAIPERPGAFRALCAALGDRAITEFNYRMGDPDRALVFVGVKVADEAERSEMVSGLGFETLDLTGNEMAKTHVRHMVGGRAPEARGERLFAFDFPERPGALGAFLDRLGARWNISLFHYRGQGAELGRVLVGFEIPPESAGAFEEFRTGVGYASSEQTANPALERFLR